MIKIAKYFLLFFFFLGSNNSFSQKSKQDFQVWGNMDVETPINKRWMIHLQHQTRFTENATQYSYSYFDVGFLYRLGRNLRFNFNYIYVNKKRIDASYSYRSQFEGYFTFRKKIGNFVFFDRFLGDMQFKDYNADAQGSRLRDYFIRNKVQLRYKLPHGITPYIAEETYYKFDGFYYERGFNRFRIFYGVLYNLNEKWLAEVGFITEYNHDAKIPTNNFMLSFGIVRTFFQ